jgi:hypothetical protein
MINIFSHYSQKENQFTNGLLSILGLSYEESPSFVHDLFEIEFSLKIPKKPLEFKVLRDISKFGDESIPDGEISNETICILIETKISSGTLREEQIRNHLKILNRKKVKFKKLILLTPDSGDSSYIKRFLAISPSKTVQLEWSRVYRYFEKYHLANKSLLSTIVGQYLDQIRDCIFNPDIAGIIMNVDFSEKSGVVPEVYLEQMQNGEWESWNTPRQYKNLDGKGRKLILYDKNMQALTMEVEIEQVKKTEIEKDYPWSNIFSPGTIKIFNYPVPVAAIRKLDGFGTFGRERSAYRNLTIKNYQIITKIASGRSK